VIIYRQDHEKNMKRKTIFNSQEYDKIYVLESMIVESSQHYMNIIYQVEQDVNGCILDKKPYNREKSSQYKLSIIY